MNGRFGITGRLVLIGLVGFMALLVLFGVLLYQMRTQEGALQAAFPLPRQVAGMVKALDQTPEQGRATLLQAFQSPSLSVIVAPDLPALGARLQRLTAVELVFSALPALRDRDVHVITEEGRGLVPGFRSWLSGVPVMVSAELDDGNYLVIQSRNVLLPRLFGVPNGFWLAAASLVIAAFTLLALVRETRPLRALTHALAQFSRNAEPVTVAPAGATDVRGLIETVNDMQQRIGAMVKGRTILAGAISHDLKTYLTRLQLRIEELPDDRERAAAEADVAAMIAIVDNAMSLAKSATGDRHRETFDFGPIIAEEAERARAGDRAVELQLAGTLSVFGDPVALRRVLVNLIDNAQRYAQTVWISAARVDDAIVLSVDDDGPGIPEAERTAIFEPFYRLDPARGVETGGSGLGLALCQQIVHSHAGRIVASASPHGGARFSVRVPVTQTEAPRIPAP